MTREDAIKRFQLMKKILSIPNSDAARTTEAIDMAVEALEREPRGEWIPCEERMPSEKKAVLICDSHGNRFVGKLVLTDYGYKWSARLFRVWIDIEDGDAWMPLPKPYGERSEE